MKTKNFFLTLLLAAMIFVPAHLGAQVTIGSTDLPQAMLDIRAYPEMDERGQGFRLIDGNHDVPGRVLTLGEDGIGTWLPSAITIISSTLTGTPTAAHTQDFYFQDFVNANVIDAMNYVYLDPGLYMVFLQVPIQFSFRLEPFERIRYNVGLMRAGATVHSFNRLHEIIGPLHADVMVRQVQMGIFDTRSDTGRTRYYVVYRNFVFWNEDGAAATGTRTGTVRINQAGMASSVFLVPMIQ